MKDKVEGVLEKIVGTVEGRQGKKVRLFVIFLFENRSRVDRRYISFSIKILRSLSIFYL